MKSNMPNHSAWIRKLIFAAAATGILALPAAGFDDSLTGSQDPLTNDTSGGIEQPHVPISGGDPFVPTREFGARGDSPLSHSDVPDLPSGRPVEKKIKDPDPFTQFAPPQHGMYGQTYQDYSDLLIDVPDQPYVPGASTLPPALRNPWTFSAPYPTGSGFSAQDAVDLSFVAAPASSIPNPGVLPIFTIIGAAAASRRRR